MTIQDLVVAPPSPRVFDYPASVAVAAASIFTTIMVIMISRFDPTGGVLTISILVILAFIGVTVFSVFFTIPTDEITSAVIGGLVAAFGAVVAHWLGRSPNGPKGGSS